ncbi:hypothetical protein ACP4OV_022448 [Aristida adscensionis]
MASHAAAAEAVAVHRQVRDGVTDAFVYLDGGAAELAACLVTTCDHHEYLAAALPDLSLVNNNALHEALALLQPLVADDPDNNPQMSTDAFLHLQIAFTSLRLLLDTHLPRTLHALGCAAVQPQQAGTVRCSSASASTSLSPWGSSCPPTRSHLKQYYILVLMRKK